MSNKSSEQAYEKFDNVFKTLEQYYAEKTRGEKLDPEIEKLSTELQTTIKNLDKKSSNEKWFTVFSVIMLAIGLLVLFWSDVEIHFIYLLRLIIFYLTPIYDLTVFNNLPCIVKNPNFVPESRFSPKICEDACQKYDKDKFLQKFQNNLNFNQTMFKEYVVESDTPIIETTEIGQWKIKNSDDIFNSFYDQLNDLTKSEFCIFDEGNSLRPKRKFTSPIGLFKQYHKSEPKSFFAQWENCGKKSSKITKKLIKRPSFFTSTIELSPNSWIFISKNYNQKEYLPIPIEQRIILFCQIKGESEILLEPHEDCKKECQIQEFLLKEGEIAIIPDLWHINYIVANKMENVILVLGAVV